jgi:NAD dependent epimerase/dehydratase family enzyme
MAQDTILGSQRVLPARLSAAGFNFEYPEIEAALEAVLAPSKQ